MVRAWELLSMLGMYGVSMDFDALGGASGIRKDTTSEGRIDGHLRSQARAS